MVGYLPHCTFNLNPRAASIDTPLHAYVPRTHVDHMHPDAIIAIAASANSQRADAARSSATRSAGCRGSGRASSSACGWRSSARKTRDAKGVVLESHGLFTWGDDAEGLLRDDAARSSTARSTGSTAETAGQAGLRRRAARSRWRPRRGARVAARLMPAIRGLISNGRPHGRPFRRQRGGAGIRQRQRHGAAGGARHLLPRPFPAHQDPPAGGRLRSGASRISTRRWPACRRQVEAYRADYAAYYDALQARRQPGAARPECGGLPGARRRHDHLRQGQGDGAHLGRVLRQRHQRDARRLDGLRPIAACPSRRPSTSNTGCSKRPSCSACRSRRALAGRIALVTGGAGGIGAATAERLLREGACVVLADIDAGALDATAAELWPSATARTWCARSRWT